VTPSGRAPKKSVLSEMLALRSRNHGHFRRKLIIVGQLKVDAINARFDGGISSLLLGIGRFSRWRFACGFCREDIAKVQSLFWSSAECPHCGARNLLPVPRFRNDPGPRP
jgi:hypothetical protein